jgi:hypothetical protein
MLHPLLGPGSRGSRARRVSEREREDKLTGGRAEKRRSKKRKLVKSPVAVEKVRYRSVVWVVMVAAVEFSSPLS